MTDLQRIAEAGVKLPINWLELGASAKDLWCERQLRSIARIEQRLARTTNSE